MFNFSYFHEKIRETYASQFKTSFILTRFFHKKNKVDTFSLLVDLVTMLDEKTMENHMLIKQFT